MYIKSRSGLNAVPGVMVLQQLPSILLNGELKNLYQKNLNLKSFNHLTVFYCGICSCEGRSSGCSLGCSSGYSLGWSEGWPLKNYGVPFRLARGYDQLLIVIWSQPIFFQIENQSMLPKVVL